jgi:hypothetical protein
VARREAGGLDFAVDVAVELGGVLKNALASVNSSSPPIDEVTADLLARLELPMDTLEEPLTTLDVSSAATPWTAPVLASVFHRIFTAFSVRPGRDLLIAAQRWPSCEYNDSKAVSSWGCHAPFLMRGSRWLHQRSRHCFAVLPGIWAATWPQFLGHSATTFLNTLSSRSVQWPLINPDRSTCAHTCHHQELCVWWKPR